MILSLGESVYGSFFEYSDLKLNQKKQLTGLFFGFSDLVLKLKKGKRNKQITAFDYVFVCFVCWFLKPETEKQK